MLVFTKRHSALFLEILALKFNQRLIFPESSVIKYSVDDEKLAFIGETDQEGVPFGKGLMFYRNGERYFGEWLDGKMNGLGVLTFADDHRRNRFEGFFKNDHLDFGTMTWKSGETYVGTFEDDLRHGFGTDIYSDGWKYTGKWSKDQWHGHGKKTFPNGDERDSFEGEFENGEVSFFGVLTWKNGDKYFGEFVKGQRTGRGTAHFQDGTKYVGEWQDNRRHGQGILYSSTGEILLQGEWKTNTFVTQ